MTYLNLTDACKVFLGNLKQTCTADDVEAWLSSQGFHVAIRCRMVIRGRSGIRRGLEALTRGGGPPPIKVAPLTGGQVPHMVFKTGAQLRSLQTRRGKPPSISSFTAFEL